MVIFKAVCGRNSSFAYFPLEFLILDTDIRIFVMLKILAVKLCLAFVKNKVGDKKFAALGFKNRVVLIFGYIFIEGKAHGNIVFVAVNMISVFGGIIFEAFANQPLCENLSAEDAKELFKEMCLNTREYLDEFYELDTYFPNK